MLFEKDSSDECLTCFAFGNAYLMVEPGGAADTAGKPIQQSPFKLRFNVIDVERTAQALTSIGISVTHLKHPWGDTAEFFDPDGNRCALRSVAGFAV